MVQKSEDEGQTWQEPEVLLQTKEPSRETGDSNFKQWALAVQYLAM